MSRLYRLDDLPFRLALERAEAQVGMVGDALNALKANYRDAIEMRLSEISPFLPDAIAQSADNRLEQRLESKPALHRGLLDRRRSSS
jgi:multidrug resistance efflux pump